MRFVYNVGIWLYSLAISVAALFNHKARLLFCGRRGLLKQIERSIPDEKVEQHIWIHCASLGEFEQGRPVIEAIRRQKPNARIILTFFSPSGYEIRKNYASVDHIFYLPADTPHAARRFIRAVKPDLAIFVKYEYWYNYLRALRQSGARSYVVSAIFRPGDIFFRPWGGLFRSMLAMIDHLYVQNQSSANMLATIGRNDRVTVAGDTRFDRVADIVAAAPILPIVEKFAGDSRVVVCGSTWQPDQEILLELMAANPDTKFIVAPHQISESAIERFISQSGRPAMRYTQRANDAATLLVIDCIGILSGVYRYGQIAYIGGGFGAGIHNILEAAAWGMPVIFGPKYQKFAEARELIELSGAVSISSGEELKERFRQVNDNVEVLSEISARYVKSHQGACSLFISEVIS